MASQVHLLRPTLYQTTQSISKRITRRTIVQTERARPPHHATPSRTDDSPKPAKRCVPNLYQPQQMQNKKQNMGSPRERSAVSEDGRLIFNCRMTCKPSFAARPCSRGSLTPPRQLAWRAKFVFYLQHSTRQLNQSATEFHVERSCKASGPCHRITPQQVEQTTRQRQLSDASQLSTNPNKCKTKSKTWGRHENGQPSPRTDEIVSICKKRASRPSRARHCSRGSLTTPRQLALRAKSTFCVQHSTRQLNQSASELHVERSCKTSGPGHRITPHQVEQTTRQSQLSDAFQISTNPNKCKTKSKTWGRHENG